MATEPAQHLAGLDVPERSRVVHAGRDHLGVVGAEGDRGHRPALQEAHHRLHHAQVPDDVQLHAASHVAAQDLDVPDRQRRDRFVVQAVDGREQFAVVFGVVPDLDFARC